MDVILPYNTDNREDFCQCALKCGFHEFVALKILYTMKDSDLDVFPMMARERLDLVLYGWELCQVHWDELKTKEDAIPPHLHTVLKQMTQYSLDVWFCSEWKECKPKYKAMLMICLKRAIDLLLKLADGTVFDWGYTLSLGTKPWDIPYLKEFVTRNCKLAKKFTQSSEHVEATATVQDIEHLKREGLLLMLLRLIKLFDAGFVEGVRRLSMRVIAAWNNEYEQCKLLTKLSYPEINSQHKQCLILICHIYLMSIYEMDDIRGFVIDNMLTNIRFYYQNMTDETSVKTAPEEELEYTPARYIAITCINLQISSNEFIDAFIYDSYDENFVSLFGVVSQSYLSYLLGNLLMEMNKLNEDDFNKCIEDFKRIIHLYIKERERSEEFMLRELHKKELKRRSHTVSKTKENMTNFYNKMCKGNRLSNIGSTEHTEENDEKKRATVEEENERRVDPVFQHLPNNEDALNYVYTVLGKRTHRGWYFAKLIVLLKIVGLQLNAIETWRYHPGLTPEFLLNLEVKLSRHFEDLAVIFQEHLFMEQEFWLTGFYLNPCKKYYETVIRSGMRSNRLSHRFETGENYDDDDDNRRDRRDRRGDRGGGDRPERVNAINAKYGLLSSTIDVKEIVKLANHEAPDVDYGQLYKALHSFKLPDNTIKDLLTIIFLPRNKSFAWALNWVELRKRCKSLLRDNEQKRHFVELNMAEANDRLTFLKVDYEKYKHRPQLDYGSIEHGYESTNIHNFNKDSSDENEDEDSEDFEADSDLDEPAKHEPKKSDHSKLFDSYFMSTRRTRARAAAMIANVMEKDAIQMKDEKVEDNADVKKANEVTADSKKDEKCAETDDTAISTKDTKRDFNDILKERKVFDNSTSGFNPFPDIWSIKGEELKIVENKVPHLETGKLFKKSAALELLKLKNANLLNQQNLKYKIAQEVIMNVEEVEAAKDEEDYIDRPKRSHQPDSQIIDADKARHNSIADTEIPDDESDVSTTARRDSDEVNDISKDEHLNKSDELLRERFSVAEKVTESPKKSTADTVPSVLVLTSIKVEKHSNDKEMETPRNDSEKEAETNENEKPAETVGIEKEDEAKENEKRAEQNENEKTAETLDIEKNSKTNETEKEREAKINNNTKKEETKVIEMETETEKASKAKEVEKETETNKKKIESKAKENERDSELIQTETESKENEMKPKSKEKEDEAESISTKIEFEMNETEIKNNENDTEIPANEIDENKSAISEQDELLKLFTRKKLRVRVRRLRVEDVHKLRQPSVRLQRMDLQAVSSRVGTLRRAERKFYTDLDDSSKSSVGSSSNERTLHETMKRTLYTSESSTESEEFKKRRRVCRPTRGRGTQSNIASAAQSRREPEQTRSSTSLKMTPRSAGGLKFRISTNEKTKSGSSNSASTSHARAGASNAKSKIPPIIDYIQISSSSSSDEEETFLQRSVIKDDDIMDITIDPLFEEEITLFRINK